MGAGAIGGQGYTSRTGRRVFSGPLYRELLYIFTRLPLSATDPAPSYSTSSCPGGPAPEQTGPVRRAHSKPKVHVVVGLRVCSPASLSLTPLISPGPSDSICIATMSTHPVPFALTVTINVKVKVNVTIIVRSFMLWKCRQMAYKLLPPPLSSKNNTNKKKT